MVSYHKASSTLLSILIIASAGDASAHKTPNPKDLELDSLAKFAQLRIKSGVGKRSGGLRAKNGYTHTSEDNLLQGPEEILASDECKPLMDELKDIEEGVLMAFDDEEIIEYSCNDIQRGESKKIADAKAQDKVGQKDPCIKAVEELESSPVTQVVIESLGSKDSCAKQVKELLQGVRAQQELAEVSVGFVGDILGYIVLGVVFPIIGIDIGDLCVINC